MKNPITEWKTKQKNDIIRQLELAYKIAEDMVKGAVDADAGMHALYGHVEAVIDCTRGKLKKRVMFLQEKIKRIWKENENASKQAYLEVEFTLFGMLVGYRGTDEHVDKPLGLKASYAAVTEKMADELLKRQAETKKQTDLAEKTVSALDTAKTSFEKMADRLVTEIKRVRSDADMQAMYAFEEGKKEAAKPVVQALPNKDGTKNGG